MVPEGGGPEEAGPTRRAAGSGPHPFDLTAPAGPERTRCGGIVAHQHTYACEALLALCVRGGILGESERDFLSHLRARIGFVMSE